MIPVSCTNRIPQPTRDCGIDLPLFLAADDVIVLTGGELIDHGIEQTEHQQGTNVHGDDQLPVPEIELEWSASDLSFETGPQLASLKGFSLQDDVTLDGYFKLRFPLFSNRVDLTIWGEACSLPLPQVSFAGRRVRMRKMMRRCTGFSPAMP